MKAQANTTHGGRGGSGHGEGRRWRSECGSARSCCEAPESQTLLLPKAFLGCDIRVCVQVLWGHLGK